MCTATADQDVKDLLFEALRGFTDQYDNNRATWPDDMVPLLDKAHAALAAASGLPRWDYDGTPRPYPPGWFQVEA